MNMLDINKLRNTEAKIVSIGSYPAIIQSILDFDFLSGKQHPSLKAIIATGRNFERYFFGKKEILIPVYSSFEEMPEKIAEVINFSLNLSSGRRVLSSTEEVLELFPNLLGGVVFAENAPEQHALSLYEKARGTRDTFLLGPASIGLLIPNAMKLGPIGGVDFRQLIDAHLLTQGSVAVLSSSGGMTNEIINTVVQYGKRISFSLSFGGERFPMTTPKEAFLAAEKDPQTKTIVYFGELGGTDEYDLAELLKAKQITKPVLCYIAGAVAEMFETPPQFGHAKAMAQKQEETAAGKRKMLKDASAHAADSYSEFLEMIKQIESDPLEEKDYATIGEDMALRKPALITTSIFSEIDGQPHLLGQDLLELANRDSFASIVSSLFLGKKIKSKELEDFVDFVLRISVDHGPSVSGAMNAIVTARAGRDLVSSLSSGLLTIGPRFGGAINQAAINWLSGVLQDKTPSDFVEDFAGKRQYISGIGHKKYRVDAPDPRVAKLKSFTDNLSQSRFTKFALGVEKITTGKKSNLILNVDGTIACVLLDILSEKEGFDDKQLQRLTEIEFFNAFFILSRSVGFIAHYLDQKRLDEGLFRLPEELVADADLGE
jgi:ATP citrate (pro-S)-lyase